jgi:aspartate carbamoyltransferase catalytic subunit
MSTELDRHASAVSIRHILDARQFSREWIERVLFPLAAQLQATPVQQLPRSLVGKRLFYLFYEPSTRTRISFETAATLLGGQVAGMDSHHHRPTDERLEDRVKVLNEYPYDFLLLRYHEEGGAERAARVARVPVINAGDGPGQHPTQALLDIYTIWRELGRLDGLRIALVGDLSYERSTNSLAYVLGRFRDLRVYLVAPTLLRMRNEAREYLKDHDVALVEVEDLHTVADDLDVLYLTRAHSERFEHAQRFARQTGGYAVDAGILARLPAHARVLHPLPRGNELPDEYDADPRIACFRQSGYGLFVRMALLTLLADGRGENSSG